MTHLRNRVCRHGVVGCSVCRKCNACPDAHIWNANSVDGIDDVFYGLVEDISSPLCMPW